MRFIDRFTRLCSEKGMSPTAVCLDLGLSNATYTYWKQQGSVPRQSVLLKIALFFGVSIDYLLGETDDRMPTDSHSAAKTPETGNKLSGVEFALYGELSGLSEEQQLDILDYVRFKKHQWENRS